jgi:hypothetical protein
LSTRLALALAPWVVLVTCGCTSVDPGANPAIAPVTFDADFYYCHVEPELIVAKRCGPGDPSMGDGSNSCHFTASAVSGMVLQDHPAIDCGGGDHPVDRTSVGMGSPAQANFGWVSLEMNKNIDQAPLFVRPSGAGGALYHPRQVFSDTDPQVITLLTTWANR